MNTSASHDCIITSSSHHHHHHRHRHHQYNKNHHRHPHHQQAIIISKSTDSQVFPSYVILNHFGVKVESEWLLFVKLSSFMGGSRFILWNCRRFEPRPIPTPSGSRFQRRVGADRFSDTRKNQYGKTFSLLCKLLFFLPIVGRGAFPGFLGDVCPMPKPIPTPILKCFLHTLF